MERAGAEDMPEDAERQGLGTPATRASILEKLVQMGFVERKGKQLLPTKDGHNLVCVLPEVLTSPQLTAEWETKLTAIAKGEADPEGFMAGIEEMTRSLISRYSQISEDAQKLFQAERIVIGKCPRCGEAVYEGKKNYYCGNRACQFVMWKNDRFFEERGKTFTPKIAAALLKDGKAKVKGLRSMKTGKTYDGTVLLAEAATFHKEFVPPVVTETGNNEDVNDYIKVSVKDQDLCSRYTARVVKNIKFAPSPKWMQERLRAHGIRPINNLVDITNYVMEEYGQPMHAYDLDTIEGKEIIVRRAAAGEKFVTLDGQERQLDENVLMICDAKKAVGIAGIMGGENSMITDHVTTMLFEAACFDGTNIRKSGKRIGLRTDASAKFEKGLDPNLAMEAMNRACQLVEELGVGEVVGGAVDIYPVKREGVKIPFEPDKYNKLLGTDIPAGDMIGYFKKIDLGYDEATNEILVPSWRQDLLCDADMAEEVARFYGYDKIGTSLPSGESTAGGKSFKLRMEEKAREIAEFCGFSQAMTYSFESPKVFDKLLIPEYSKWRKTVVISNPLGEDYSIMRTLPLNGMLTSLSTNFGRRNKDVRLYEMGNIYLPKQLPLTELPEERMQLTFGMYGDGDFFTMKGVIEELLYQTGLRKKAQYDPHAELPFLHPGRKAAIVYDGAVIGYLGEVHPTVAANYAIKERVYIAVIDMPEMVSRASFDYKYEGITNFPVSSRDLSMVVPKNILVGDIEKVFEENGGKYLENYELFDVYEGEQIEKGFKSVAYSLKFRGKDKNLEESDITGAMDKILSGLKNIGIQLRG